MWWGLKADSVVGVGAQNLAHPVCALMQNCWALKILCSSNSFCSPINRPLWTHSASSIAQVFRSAPEPISEICHLTAAWNVKGAEEMTHQRRSPPHVSWNKHQEIEQSFWVPTLISQQTEQIKYNLPGFCYFAPSSQRIRTFGSLYVESFIGSSSSVPSPPNPHPFF